MNTKNNGMETDNPFQINSRVRVTPRTSLEYTIYIDGEIGPPSEYRDETQILLNASQNDDISIVINSHGGQVNTAQQLIEAINYSSANVSAILVGDCSSAATMIALSCPNVVVLDSAEFMIHNGSYISGGISPRVKDHADFTHTQLNNMIDKYYTGFLTKKEIADVKNGVEFWFNANEIRERFKTRQKFLKSKYDKEQKESQKLQEKVTETTE